MPTRRTIEARVIANPPDGWRSLFAWKPNCRSAKVRCLLCGSTGYGGLLRPLPWQVAHILGHPERCETCRRPFISRLALSSHRTCKLHHDCCREHTTVPEWKNPFGGAA